MTSASAPSRRATPSGGGPLSLPAAPSANPAGSVVASWSLYAVAPCSAPGYGPGAFTGPPVLSEGFDAGTLPPGWSVNTVSGVSWQVASGADPCGQFDGNRTGGSGPYAILNSACFSVGTDDSSLVTAPMDLSWKTTVAIQWANDFVDFDSGTVAGVDVSIDGGATWENVWIAPRPDLQGPGDPLADMSFAAGQPRRAGPLPLQRFLGLVVAGGRRRGRRVRLHARCPAGSSWATSPTPTRDSV